MEEGAGFMVSLIFKDPFSFHTESYTHFPHLEVSLFSLILFCFLSLLLPAFMLTLVTYILYLLTCPFICTFPSPSAALLGILQDYCAYFDTSFSADVTSLIRIIDW